MYKQTINTPQRKYNANAMAGIDLKCWEEELQALEEELKKMDPAELRALEEEIANEKAQELIRLIEEPTEEKSYGETYWGNLLKEVDIPQYISDVKQLQRIKRIRKETMCDGIKCLFSRRSGINPNANYYWCEHLEALMTGN